MLYEYVGAVHIHSVYSDGSGKIEDIAKAAFDSELDFIMMTDHNTIKPKEDNYARWLNNIMVIIGYEVNDEKNRNHYLTFGLNELVGSYKVLENGELGCKLTAKEYVEQIKEKGGIGFKAHPDEERIQLKDYPSYPWTENGSDSYTGIEIWNHMSEWVEGMNENNKLERFLHPLKSIAAPSEKTLKRWDDASAKRHVTGIGGVDAHAFKQNILGLLEFEVFPYKVLFKSIRTHVLLEEELTVNNNSSYALDEKNILNALKKGKCFVSNYYHGNAKGFRFYAEYKSNTFFTGDTIKFSDGKIKLTVLSPKESNIKLIHNGKKVNEVNRMNLSCDVTEKGIYRIECWLNGKGWIFSNHIRVE